jgi:hypothetical protein
MLTWTLPRPRRASLALARWLCALWLLISGAISPAQDTPLTEADLKAAFLFNFAKFVDWPKEAFTSDDAKIVIGIYGDEEFATTLRTLLQTKKAHGRGFTVRRVTTAQEARSAHLLFFRESETRRLGQVIDGIRRLPVLTVGESSEFLDMGGMLNLFFEDKQLRFDVNPAAADAAQLTMSSQLLRLAKNVRKGGAK